jgi:hypothetical protein
VSDPGSDERQAQRARTLRILGVSALSDVLIGLGLLLYGRQEESTGIVIAGVAVGLAGLFVGSWVLVARDRPQQR